MEEAVTMTSVVSTLTTSLSASNLWGAVAEVVPLIAISVLFGLGFTLIKRVLRKVRSAKGGM